MSVDLTTEQVAGGIRRLCQSSAQEREQGMEQVSRALQGSPEWNTFLRELLQSLGGMAAEQQTGALILTCFVLGVEVGRGSDVGEP